MAGLLRFILALAFAGAVLWVGLPLAASAAAGAVVSAAGLRAKDVTVSVEARPPLKLLLLEADAVRVRSGPGTFRGATFGGLDVTLSDVGLGKPPGSVEGRIEAVEFTDASGAPVRADSITLSGAAATPDVLVRIGAGEISTLVGRVLPAEIVPTAAIALSAPDGVRISTIIGELRGRLVAATDGSMQMLIDIAGAATVTVTVFVPGPALPLRLRSVAVEGGALVLTGTVDAAALGL